jgi:hypothetical protein
MWLPWQEVSWTCLFSLYTVCALILQCVGVNITQRTPERHHGLHIDPACLALLNEWMNECMNTSSCNQQWLAAQQPLLEPPVQLTLASFHHKTNHAPPPLAKLVKTPIRVNPPDFSLCGAYGSSTGRRAWINFYRRNYIYSELALSGLRPI